MTLYRGAGGGLLRGPGGGLAGNANCCCDIVSCICIPDVVTATVVSATGGCTSLIGSTATLTKAVEIWSGTMNNVGDMAFTCGGGELGCPDNVEVTLSISGQCTSVQRACIQTDPCVQTFTFTAGGLGCCGGVAGTFTIEVG